MKKTISILLAVILILSAPASVIGFAQGGCDCGNAPVVYVRGFGASLYLNPDSENPEQVFMTPTSEILSAVPDIFSAVNALLITKNSDKFIDSIINVLNAMFGKLYFDNNGNSVNDIGVLCPLPTVDTHKIRSLNFDATTAEAGGEFKFEYDWRADPVAVAEDLNEYINAVCALTKHDKIILCAHSEGNCIAASYLEKFGTDKLEKTVFMSGAFQGLGLVGHLFTKDVSVNGKSDEFVAFIDTFLGGESGGDILAAIFSILDNAGILDRLLSLVENTLVEQKDRLYDELLIDLFATMPGIWSFVPQEYYEQAKTLMLGGDEKYAELINKIDYYHNNVQGQLGALLTQAKSNGVAVALTCGYGIAPIPVYENSAEHCDMLIDTKYTSIGATCAKIGETLDYTPASHASSDGIIDASTCLFPDSTWFTKYQDHNDFCEAYREFLMWLVEYDGQPTVTSSANYPQFMTCRDNHTRLVPLEQGQERAEYPNNFVKIFASIFKLMALSSAK